MIHNPSGVACRPFGAGTAESNTISTFPTLRVRMRAGSTRDAAVTTPAVAANANISLRFMAAPLRAIFHQPLHARSALRSAPEHSPQWTGRQPHQARDNHDRQKPPRGARDEGGVEHRSLKTAQNSAA